MMSVEKIQQELRKARAVAGDTEESFKGISSQDIFTPLTSAKLFEILNIARQCYGLLQSAKDETQSNARHAASASQTALEVRHIAAGALLDSQSPEADEVNSAAITLTEAADRVGAYGYLHTKLTEEVIPAYQKFLGSLGSLAVETQTADAAAELGPAAVQGFHEATEVYLRTLNNGGDSPSV
jgi:hypothetical protein